MSCRSESSGPARRHCTLHSSWGQLGILSFVYFCNTGMWNALNTIGGLGTGDPEVSHICDTTSYGVAIIAGFFAGSAVNMLGLRWAAIIGSVGQFQEFLFIYLVHYQGLPNWLLYVSSVLGGMLTGWMLAAVASGLVHLPTESERSMFLAIGSAILNLGGVLGALLSLAMNWSADDQDGGGLTSTSFMILMIIGGGGVMFASCIARPETVLKTDGSHPSIPTLTLREELQGVIKGIREPMLWLLVPLFVCALWHEVTVFNYFNIALSNVRTRAMHTFYYYAARIVSSFLFQYVCDMVKSSFPRRMDAATLCTAGFLVMATVSSGLIFGNYGNILDKSPIDFTEQPAQVLFFCFFAWGSLETIGSSYSFWVIGAMPLEDPNLANRFVGWFRTFGALGGFLSWAIDFAGTPHLTQYITCVAWWALALTGLTVLRFKFANMAKQAPSPADLSLGDLSVVPYDTPSTTDQLSPEMPRVFPSKTTL